ALVQGTAEFAREIRHVVEIPYAALVNPTLQLFGTKRLAAERRHQGRQRGGVHAKQIGTGNNGRHYVQGARTRGILKLTAVDVAFGEEESNFNSGGFGGIGTMNGVGIDAVREVGTDGTRVGLLGIGGAHQFTVLRNGVLAFQHLHEHGTGDHEFNQVLEEGALFVNGIETLCISARKLHQTCGHDLQASLLETCDDLSDHVLGDCIGLDDGKGAFNSHLISVRLLRGCKAAAASGRSAGFKENRYKTNTSAQL